MGTIEELAASIKRRNITDNTVFVGDEMCDSKLGFFMDASFASDLQDSNLRRCCLIHETPPHPCDPFEKNINTLMSLA